MDNTHDDKLKETINKIFSEMLDKLDKDLLKSKIKLAEKYQELGRNTYNLRTWLNKTDSPNSSSIFSFHGNIKYKDEDVDSIFLKISDSHNSINLHKEDYDSADDFIDKMVLLRNHIDAFITFLNSIYK